MGINNKYTPEQRKIVWQIYNLKNMQKAARRKWLDLDIKINNLQNIINNKKW